MAEFRRRDILHFLAAGLPAVSGCLGGGSGGNGNGTATTTGEVSLVDTDEVTTTSVSQTGNAATTTSGATTSASTTQTSTTTASTTTATWEYTDWLPAPASLGTDGLYRFIRVDGGAVAANKQSIATDTYDFYKRALELQVKPTGIAMSAMSMLVFQDIRVVTGEFTADTVTERLTNSGYTKQQDYEEYTVYKNADTGHSVGVNGDTMVWNRNTEGTDRAGTVEVAVDAKTGGVSRLVTARSAVADLLSALGDGVVVSGMPPEGEWVVQGAAVSIDGDTSEVRDARVYENEDAVDIEGFKSDLQQVRESKGVESVSVEANGRVAVATISAETATYGSTVMQRLIA